MLNYSALGQAIDTTWGNSSMPACSSYSLKISMVGTDTVSIMYQTRTNFGSRARMINSKREEEEKANSIIKDAVSMIKKKYSEVTDGETISLKELKEKAVDSLEIVGMAVHNSNRTGLYRKKCIFEIS